jgi:hypothetical protein
MLKTAFYYSILGLAIGYFFGKLHRTNKPRTIKSSARHGKLNRITVKRIIKNIAKLRNKSDDLA